MDRETIIKKAMAKLSKGLSEDELMEIIFKDYVSKEELIMPNFAKNMEISEDQYDELKKIFSTGPVKKRINLGDFGFVFKGLQFQVNPTDIEIKRI